jgi:hypothetical protein
MDREYDLFEVFPDGSLVWRDSVTGHQNTIRRLRELAALTDSEFRLTHVPTNTLIASLKKRSPELRPRRPT